MKTVTILLLLLLASPAFGQLTKEDLRTIIKEENTALEKHLREYIDLKIDGVEKSLNARIDATNAKIDSVENNLSAKIDSVENNLSAKIDSVENNLNARIGDVDKKFDRVWYMIIALIGLIAAAIAIPQIVVAYKDRKDMERDQKAMQSQIDQLRKELEAMQQ